MTLAFNFYCVVILSIAGIYHLPYFNVDENGNKIYPKFFYNVNIYNHLVQDGTTKDFNYTYPSTYKNRLDSYCDNVLDCDTSAWSFPTIKNMYDNFTTFTFTLRYVDDNGNQNVRSGQISPSQTEQVTEPIFGTFVTNFHCPEQYETLHFRKVFTITKPDGQLFEDYSTYVNFTLNTVKIGCAGSCDKNNLNIRDYSPFEEQFDAIIPIPEEPVQTESENSE